MQPAAVRGWVELAFRDGVQYLLHHGVGCQIPIGPQSFAAALHCSPDDDVFIVGRDGVAKPVGELVPKRLFETSDGSRLAIASMTEKTI